MSSLATVWSDIKEAFLPPVAFADDKKEEDEESGEEQAEESEESGEAEDGGDGDADEDEDEDDDDDEDEDEVKDPMDELREKYTEGVCHSFKHHFDECVERVTAAQQEDGYEDREYKEDCVEEFFHWQHCLNDNLTTSLFTKLK